MVCDWLCNFCEFCKIVWVWLVMRKISFVDEYIEIVEYWVFEFKKFRKILFFFDLEEVVKWSSLCYLFDGKLIVGLGSFKVYVGFWFF